MSYLIIAVLMFGAGVGTTYGLMSARVAVVTERNFWLERTVSGLATSVQAQAKRINNMIANPLVAVRANERIRDFQAKSRYRHGLP